MKNNIFKLLIFFIIGLSIFLLGLWFSMGTDPATEKSIIGRSIMFVALIFLAWTLIKAANLSFKDKNQKL